MKPTVLVVTTLHHPDDTRIRERLIRSLAGSFEVTYVTRSPGPSDEGGLTWVGLRGGRLRRNVGALRVLLRSRWDVAVVHDPELIPSACLARVVRSRPVVFDVHEDLPSQIEAKSWIPAILKPVGRAVSRALFAIAERCLHVTLAEEGYQRLFREARPVVPNYPAVDTWPQCPPTGDGTAVYVGDIQPGRGIAESIIATGRVGVPLVLVGPASPETLDLMSGLAEESGCDLTWEGRLPNRSALEVMARASVGLSLLHDLANYRRSLPTKVIEYLAAGTPVVATDLEGTREAVGHLDAVTLVSPNDLDAMASAIAASIDGHCKQAAADQAPLVRSVFRWPDTEIVNFYLDLATP